MKKLLCASLMVLLAVTTAFAKDDANTVENLLKSKIQAVLKVLENPELTAAKKAPLLEGIVDPVFNYELMARLTLGKKYWPALTPRQQAVFTQRFIKRLKASYLGKITLYSGDTLARVTYKPATASGNKVDVPVSITEKDRTVDMLYRFYRFEAGWKIYDVEINGVSIVSSYRAQFAQVLSHGTIEDLLSELKQTKTK